MEAADLRRLPSEEGGEKCLFDAEMIRSSFKVIVWARTQTSPHTHLYLCSVSSSDVGDSPAGLLLYRLLGAAQEMK